MTNVFDGGYTYPGPDDWNEEEEDCPTYCPEPNKKDGEKYDQEA